MCGRYYVDDETSREIEKIVRKLDQRLKIEHGQDIHPSESAVILTKECKEVAARQMQWGFPGFQGKGLLINARAEAILDKKTFRDSVLHRRCVIPAHHFYEWSKNKEKYTFQSPKQDATLFMAGCYQIYNGQNRFVILTTQANASVAPVHERMPLLLERQELEDWIMEDAAVEFILAKKPILLNRTAEYEQLKLFSQEGKPIKVSLLDIKIFEFRIHCLFVLLLQA